MRLLFNMLYLVVAGLWLGRFVAFLIGKYEPTKADTGFMMLFVTVVFLLWGVEGFVKTRRAKTCTD